MWKRKLFNHCFIKFEKVRALWHEGSHWQKILEFGGSNISFPGVHTLEMISADQLFEQNSNIFQFKNPAFPIIK